MFKRLAIAILCYFVAFFGFILILRGIGLQITWGFLKYPERMSYINDLETYRQWAWKQLIQDCYVKEGIPEWFIYIDMFGIPMGLLLMCIGTALSLKLIFQTTTLGLGLLIFILSLIFGTLLNIIIIDLKPYGLTILGMTIPPSLEFLIPIILFGIYISLSLILGKIYHLIKRNEEPRNLN